MRVRPLWLAAVLLTVGLTTPAQAIDVGSGENSGPGTLRQAIIDANATPAADDIVISPAVITLASALPTITTPVTIKVSGPTNPLSHTVLRSAQAPPFRIFDIAPAAGSVSMAGLTISGGLADTGGGIRSQAALTLDQMIISGNAAQRDAGAAHGGGLLTSADTVITRTRITDNTAASTNGAAEGAAVYHDVGTLQITNSTIDANVAHALFPNPESTITVAGDPVSATIDRSTLTGNTAGTLYYSTVDAVTTFLDSTLASTAGVVLWAADFSAMSLTNTIVTRTQANHAACSGQTANITSAGFNLFFGTGCVSTATDVTGQDPLLGDLTGAFNPLSPMRPIGTDSPALDAGKAAGMVDQRLVPRPQDAPGAPNAPTGNGSDIGAFEAADDHTGPVVSFNAVPSSPNPNDAFTFTILVSERFYPPHHCSLDGSVQFECSSPYTVDGLGDGSHTFFVIAFDVWGNQGVAPATATWTVSVEPQTLLTQQPAGTVQDPMPFIFSSSRADSTFECTLNGGAPFACTSPFNPDLADGEWTVTVRAINAVGKPDPTPETATFTVDTTGPESAIDSGPSGETAETGATFAFSSLDGTATFRCKLDDGAEAACTSPMAYTGLALGAHTFTVRATDAVGNAEPEAATRTWTVKPAATPTPTATATATATATPTATASPTATPTDTTPPDTTITKGPRQTTSRRPKFSFASTEADSTFRCKLDKGDFRACRSGKKLPKLKPGRHTLRVAAVDRAGNEDPTPAKRRFTIKR